MTDSFDFRCPATALSIGEDTPLGLVLNIPVVGNDGIIIDNFHVLEIHNEFSSNDLAISKKDKAQEPHKWK